MKNLNIRYIKKRITYAMIFGFLTYVIITTLVKFM